ncbi:MAG: hypothetical protein ACR2O6_03530 [Ilumatobacteraceae bacterium]
MDRVWSPVRPLQQDDLSAVRCEHIDLAVAVEVVGDRRVDRPRDRRHDDVLRPVFRPAGRSDDPHGQQATCRPSGADVRRPASPDGRSDGTVWIRMHTHNRPSIGRCDGWQAIDDSRAGSLQFGDGRGAVFLQ